MKTEMTETTRQASPTYLEVCLIETHTHTHKNQVVLLKVALSNLEKFFCIKKKALCPKLS